MYRKLGACHLALNSDLINYGKNHPSVALGYNNLGSAWQDKGDLDKASGHFQQALAIFKATYGEAHRYTIMVQSNLYKLQLAIASK